MSDMTTEPNGSNIAAVVDKELDRRRRLLRLFTVLLAVPLLAALGFAFFGRSDAQMVQQEVQNQVAPVKKELAGLPDLKEIKATQERVSGLPARFESLSQTVQQVDFVQKNQLVPDINQLKAFQDRVSGLPAQVASLQAGAQDVNELRTRVEQYRAESSKQAQRLNNLEERVFKKFEEPPSPKEIIVLREQIGRDQARIKDLEQENARLKSVCRPVEKPPGMGQ